MLNCHIHIPPNSTIELNENIEYVLTRDNSLISVIIVPFEMSDVEPTLLTSDFGSIILFYRNYSPNSTPRILDITLISWNKMNM